MIDFDSLDYGLLEKEVDFYLKTLFPMNRSILNSGVRDTLQILQNLTEFSVIDIPSGTKCYDWVVPDQWEVEDAYIEDEDKNIIIDYRHNNLHVLNYSTSIDKIMSFDELEKKLYYLPQLPDAIPYKTSYYNKNYGFCLSYNQFKELDRSKKYHLVIRSTFTKGSIKVGEYILRGKSSEEIILSSYTCHPSMANDGISGMVLWAVLLKTLKKKNLHYTYRFVLLPETIGAIAYLNLKETEIKQNVKHGLVLTTVGGPGKFGYKESFKGNDLIDRCVVKAFEELNIDFIKYPFDIYGSDERQYSSLAFRIPCATISKDKYYEYKEYHTSLDNLDFVRPSYIIESFKVYLNAINILEMSSSVFISTSHACEPFLSQRNLFPTIGLTISNCEEISSDHNKNLYEVGEIGRVSGMEIEEILWLMFYCDGTNTIFDISEKTTIQVSNLYRTAMVLVNHALLEEQVR